MIRNGWIPFIRNVPLLMATPSVSNSPRSTGMNGIRLFLYSPQINVFSTNTFNYIDGTRWIFTLIHLCPPTI